MPSLLPLQRFHSRCPTCGVGYHIGYSYSHHVKWCSRKKDPPAAGGPCHSDERDYEHEHNDPACSVESADEGAIAVSTDGREVCRPDEEIVRYFADDVDRPGLLQCANWGAKELRPNKKKRFVSCRSSMLETAHPDGSRRVCLITPAGLAGTAFFYPAASSAAGKYWTRYHTTLHFQIPNLNSNFKFCNSNSDCTSQF